MPMSFGGLYRGTCENNAVKNLIMSEVVERLKINTEIAHQKYMDCNSDTPAVEYAICGTQHQERRKCLDIVNSGIELKTVIVWVVEK